MEVDPPVVVVDPYSSGMFLIQELVDRGEKIIAVRSTLNLTPALMHSFAPELYFGVYDVPEGELPSVSAKNIEKEFGKPKACFIGSEPGVILAERLQDIWRFPCNDSRQSELRRNKALQQEKLKMSGLKSIRQMYSNKVDKILQYRQHNMKFPVVVKPAMSAGTDGVFFCNSDEQVKEACEANLGKIDILGCRNDKVLIQEFLQGVEYVVDAFSKDGKHVISGIWVYKKECNVKQGSITYDRTELLPSRGKVQDELREYMLAKGGVLDTLGINQGPSHAEVMMTPQGPCLVECANRMHGSDGPKTVELCTGTGQHNLYVDTLLGDSHIFDHMRIQDHYILDKHAICLSLINEERNGLRGVLARNVDCPELRLACKRSFYWIDAAKAGEPLEITRCLLTSPGECLLIHKNYNIIREECAAIRKLEKSGRLYFIEELKPGAGAESDTSETRSTETESSYSDE